MRLPTVPLAPAPRRVARDRARRRRAGVAAVTAVGGALVLAGCQTVQGPVMTLDREVWGVSGVDLRTSGDLTVVVGGATSLSVTAVESVLPRLTSEVVDGVLVLDVTGPGRWFGDAQIAYTLTVPVAATLETVTVRGSGDVEADGVAPESLAVSVDGSGDVRLTDVDVDVVRVDVDGSGEVRLEGTARDQQVTIAGSGGYDAAGVRGRDATVAVEGSGDARLDVSGVLEATVAGSGSVRYAGDPAVTSIVTGSGEVEAS